MGRQNTTAARLTGLGRPDALAIGVLMNCRGLTELVVLDIGLQLGVIDATVFAMLVVMALVSTLATAPGLSLLDRYGPPRAPGCGDRSARANNDMPAAGFYGRDPTGCADRRSRSTGPLEARSGR